MLEMCYSKDIFLLPGNNEAAAVTTNGIVKKDHKAVMGAGIAKYAKDNFPGIDLVLGKLLDAYGNHAYYLGSYECPAKKQAGNYLTSVNVVTFPTKNHWYDNSDLELIRQSAKELMVLADERGLQKIYAPMPGCNNGRLDYCSQVRPVLIPMLDDRFVICLDDETFGRIYGSGPYRSLGGWNGLAKAKTEPGDRRMKNE